MIQIMNINFKHMVQFMNNVIEKLNMQLVNNVIQLWNLILAIMCLLTNQKSRFVVFPDEICNVLYIM